MRHDGAVVPISKTSSGGCWQSGTREQFMATQIREVVDEWIGPQTACG
jgi:hypothetical protein